MRSGWGAALLCGCGGWPLWANLPEDEAGWPAQEDPRASVEVEWTSWSAPDVSQPPGATVPLDAGGVLIEGELRGVGWSDTATPAPLSGPEGCPADGVRSPLPGDWIGDVDVYEVSVTRPGRLCVRADVGDAETGIDLIAWRLECGVPVSLVGDGDEPLGLGQAGPVVGWSAEVAEGDHLSLILASYAPNEETRSLPYQLGVVLVDGALCPLLPSEAR